MTRFRFPGGDERTVFIGATGSGKTTCAAWMLAHMRFDARPWVIVDFKRERIFDDVGSPPIIGLSLGKLPKRRGVYIITPDPGDEAALELWLWRVWGHENIGLFVDEAYLMPDSTAWRAVLQQGRSKRIPVLICTQRPVDVIRAVFSEASYYCVFRINDRRDARVIEGFVPTDLQAVPPKRHWLWYDVADNTLLQMAPVPPPKQVAELLRRRIPYIWTPFGNWLRPEPSRLSPPS
jgi:DNA helicase HerA-like ATPase